MPWKPPRPCRVFGCPNLAHGGFCDQHKRERWQQQDRERESAPKRGYGRRWGRLRGMVLHRHPICPCGAPATEVDHIMPKSAGGDDRMDNLQALCKSCHSAKTMKELRGG